MASRRRRARLVPLLAILPMIECVAGQSQDGAPISAREYINSILVSATPRGGGAQVDPNLRDPWGIDPSYFNEEGNPTFLTANDGSRTVGRYDRSGDTVATAVSPQRVTPKGIVVNRAGGDHYFLSGSLCVADVIAASEAGEIVAWGNSLFCGPVPGMVGFTAPTVAYTSPDAAIYTSLTQAFNPSSLYQFLFAVDFHNNRIDVFDGDFARQGSSGTRFAFSDPQLPPGYAAFGIRAVRAVDSARIDRYRILVTYAQRNPLSPDQPAFGQGLGLVDVFDTNGKFVKRLVSPGGALNAPWGLTLAPADFGALGNTLLVANTGDGRINAYDPDSGQFIDTVSDTNSAPIEIPGLRGLAFEDVATADDTSLVNDDVLFYTAAGGPGSHGLIGNIHVPR